MSKSVYRITKDGSLTQLALSPEGKSVATNSKALKSSTPILDVYIYVERRYALYIRSNQPASQPVSLGNRRIECRRCS